MQRYQPRCLGLAGQCDACQEPVFFSFEPVYDFGHRKVGVPGDALKPVERAQESYEFSYLHGEIASDFREALACYSASCFNAFAAMCRRTIQTTATVLGASGKDRVQHQIQDLQQLLDVDDDTYSALKQIILDGHDGAHPHLPSLSAARAEILLELMKDVLYQLIVRQAKLKEAAAKRRDAIEAKHARSSNSDADGGSPG